MSWIWNPSGDAPKPSVEDNLVQDPSDPNRKVSQKAANRPFLACVTFHSALLPNSNLILCSHKQYKDRQAKEHKAWLQRKREREEKLARGEKVGPEEADPTAEQEVGLLGLLKFIVYLILTVLIAGKFFTGSFLWEYEGKWAQLKTYWPVRLVLFNYT